MPRFLVQNKEILKLFKEYQEEIKDQHRKAREMMVEFGAEDYALKYEFGLIGMKFSGTPNVKLWRWVDRSYDLWVPKRNSKEGKELYKKFKSLKGVTFEKVSKACGFLDWILIDGRIMVRSPGVEQLDNGEVILDIREEVLVHKNFKKPDDIEEITFETYLRMKEKKTSTSKPKITT